MGIDPGTSSWEAGGSWADGGRQSAVRQRRAVCVEDGISWEDLPARFGKWNSVWRRFDRWCENGVWETLARTLGAPDAAKIHLDSSSVKAHPAASTGLLAASEEKEEADARRCLGRSRGGLTTKIHAVVSSCGRLVNCVPTPGQRGDAPQAETLLADFTPGQVEFVVADAAYDSDAIRRRIKRLQAKACIGPNKTLKSRNATTVDGTKDVTSSNASSDVSKNAAASPHATKRKPETSSASSGSRSSLHSQDECPGCRGLASRVSKAFTPTTTERDPTKRPVPNALDRDFTATRPNEKWVTDIT